jgi:hypothetical protein
MDLRINLPLLRYTKNCAESDRIALHPADTVLSR